MAEKLCILGMRLGGRYNTLPLINTGAILFTIEVVKNLLFVVREDMD